MAKLDNDRFTLEIIKNALVAVADEMFSAMQRTSMSPIIYETLDFSCGLTDAQGNLITQGNGTTVFLGMIDSLVRDVIKKYGENAGIAPGDMFISNDPYIGGGTHLSDPALVQPIFFEDEIVAAEMPAGSVVVFTGGVFHGGGENNSDTVRTGMTLQYTWGWLHQEENQYLANPPEIAQTYSEELRRV